MKQFVSKAKEFDNSTLLPVGEYATKIDSIVETLSKASKSWNDRTEQIEVNFKTADDRTIKAWYNLVGFVNQTDCEDGIAPKGHEFRSSENGSEQYLVNKTTGMRVESTGKTATAIDIFQKMANDAGITQGENFTIADLQGKAVGVKVRAKSNSVEVHYTMPVRRVKEAVAA